MNINIGETYGTLKSYLSHSNCGKFEYFSSAFRKGGRVLFVFRNEAGIFDLWIAVFCNVSTHRHNIVSYLCNERSDIHNSKLLVFWRHNFKRLFAFCLVFPSRLNPTERNVECDCWGRHRQLHLFCWSRKWSTGSLKSVLLPRLIHLEHASEHVFYRGT